MLFPIVRHIQRYEYIGMSDYITDKTVLDIGCGSAYGTVLLSNWASEIIGLDPKLAEYKDNVNMPVFQCPGRIPGKVHLLDKCWEDVNVGQSQVNVIVALELIEHLANPKKFVEFASVLGDYLFITTPLAKKTGSTDNMEHVNEYSKKSMRNMLSKHFDILKTVYQHADLRITADAVANGSSINPDHVVQMYWCQSKRRKR